MFKQAYYKGLIKVAQGIPAYDPTKHDLPRQWFTDRGYTQDQYNEYKNVGYWLNPIERNQRVRRKIDTDSKVKQLQEAAKAQGQDPNNVSGTFRHGKLVQPSATQPGASVPAQPPQRVQPQKQPPAVAKQAPVRQPAQPRPQAPAAGPNTQIRHRGYTWTPFINGAAARKYYGGNVIGTKINGQAYYRPFNAEDSTSTRSAQRPGKRVVVPAYRRIM